MESSDDSETEESDDSDLDGPVNIELYRGGDRQLDNILRLLDDDEDDDEDFEGFLPNFEKNVDFDFDDDLPEVSDLDFSERSGIRRVFDTSATPLDYFQLYFTDELFEKIIFWTDKNARHKIENDPQHHKGAWTTPSLSEIKAFFGIKLAMLFCVYCPRMERYFCEKPGQWIFFTPGFPKVFTYRRFVQINRYLHFCDEEHADNSHKLYKLLPYLDYLQVKFEAEYYPGQNLSIDECMIPFKGRLRIKQYIKDKPTKWGVKAFLLCDSETAYCYRFEIYISQNNEFEGKNIGLSTAVVLNLTQGLENRGHIVYTDNFYTSPILGYNLRLRGIGLVGTVRSNRKGFPKVLAQVKEKDLNRGECIWKASGNMLACVWKDKRLVNFLSTVHQPTITQVARRNKGGVQEMVNTLQLITDYNSNMGGVDRNDQMASLPKYAKQYRWYMRVALKAVLWAVLNAYILEDHVVKHRKERGRNRDFQSFVDELVHELVGDHRAERKKRGRPSAEVADRLLNLGHHFPTADENDSTNHVCVVCAKKQHVYSNAHNGVGRKDNPFKLVKTVFKYSECKVYLCVKKGSTCFQDYHTKVQYWR